MSNEPSTPESDDKSNAPRLSSEEAKAVIRAISDVEREEAETASDEPSSSETA